MCESFENKRFKGASLLGGPTPVWATMPWPFWRMLLGTGRASRERGSKLPRPPELPSGENPRRLVLGRVLCKTRESSCWSFDESRQRKSQIHILTVLPSRMTPSAGAGILVPPDQACLQDALAEADARKAPSVQVRPGREGRGPGAQVLAASTNPEVRIS